MSKLKVKLIKVGDTILCAKVLEQCESLRGKRDLYKSDNFVIHSDINPELRPQDFYIQGRERTRDKDLARYTFSCQKYRDEMHDFIIEAVNYINKEDSQEDQDEDIETTIVG